MHILISIVQYYPHIIIHIFIITSFGLISLLQKFERRNVKLCGVSCENVPDLKRWIDDMKSFYSLEEFNISLVADEDRRIAFL